MVKRKTTKSDDISNWAVVLMLVAVIVVSTLSIVLFMDAADSAITQDGAGATGDISLKIVNPSEDVDNDTAFLVEKADEAGQVELTIEG